MIPKTIHFCWLSNDPFPTKISRCMESWQKLHPDFTIKRWCTDNFDVNSVPYVREAFEARKWAFAADYIRMYALYTEGGIYLDSDVLLHKRLDSFLDNRFFSCMEYHQPLIDQTQSYNSLDANSRRLDGVPFVSGIEIQAAVLGAEPGNIFVRDVLDYYKDKHFTNEDGSFNTNPIAPCIYAIVAEKYGFVYKDVEQVLADGQIHIYPSFVFAGNKYETTPDSFATHMCAHSWHPTVKEKLASFFKKYF